MLNKLLSHTKKVCTKNSLVKRVSYARFGNDIMQKEDLLRENAVPGQHIVKQTDVLNAQKICGEDSSDKSIENVNILTCTKTDKKSMLGLY